MTVVLADASMPKVSLGNAPEKRRLPVLPVAQLLQAQQSLTLVERFAKRHDAGEVRETRYSELLPLERPRPGEQYAFEVDLDACTGCKACVAACHTMNGLDETEIWRTVGLLHGGTPAAPALQTVTTSCHHCIEPACMAGCPVKAYEKDPITGIVKHLDDQCIGCQYCTLMCPYDAPKYNKNLGIVRKCDMCSDRLAHDEAPACVEACPNEAIAIRIVDRTTAVEASDAQTFLPGAPAPEHTLPTTTYKTKRAMPPNMLPADFYGTKPEHSHPPLVVMLTLTQLSVGAFVTSLLIERLVGRPAGSVVAQTAVACGFSLVALFASVFHLGRPQYAYRAFLGLRTSWLSREAVAFGVFAKFGVLYGLMSAAPLFAKLPFAGLLERAAEVVGTLAAVVGVVGVFCSVMVYVATRRAQWSGAQTGIKFFGTTLSLGALSALTVALFTGSTDIVDERISRALLQLALATTALKLFFELSVLRYLRERRLSVFKRIATLMTGELRAAMVLRFALGVTGGVLLPWLLLGGAFARESAAFVAAVALGLTLVSELFERYLFFRAAPASRMPGGIR
jgi:formate dehydrogenase iron-sulfur subunit